MIFSELVVYNFGTFRGRNCINLLPPTPERPLVLVGGLNGGGKTTILDAMQLALYGARAEISSRNGLGWQAYLKQSIHRGVPATEGAGVELEFLAHDQERAVRYRVSRSWSPRDTGVKESLLVTVDGLADQVLTDSWNERVQEFIPVEMAGLFFFDGEKIKALADPDKSGPLIGAGIKSLLGTGLVEQLGQDLKVLERRHQKQLDQVADTADVSQLRLLDEELASLLLERESATQRCGNAQVALDTAKMAVDRALHEYREAGGELAENREQLEAERAHFEAELAAASLELVGSAASALPLALLGRQLSALIVQADSETEAELGKLVESRLAARAEQALKALRAADVSEDLVDKVVAALEVGAEVGDDHAPYLGLDGSTRRNLDSLVSIGLDEVVGLAEARLSRYERAVEGCDVNERQLAQLPEANEIAPILKRRAEAQEALDSAAQRVLDADVERERLDRLVERTERERDRTARRVAEVELEHDSAQRLIHFSSKARTVLEDFVSRLTAKYATLIEASIYESFQRLLRKESMLSAVRLDPEDFSVSLVGRDDREVPVERLSAGERQLLATALLWGLGRLAGREIPAVIDTPLGRLDSVHRRILVDHYFPAASHQVILLSTDEEIDRELFGALSPRLARAYTVEYDHELDHSRVVDGYFWSEEAQSVA